MSFINPQAVRQEMPQPLAGGTASATHAAATLSFLSAGTGNSHAIDAGGGIAFSYGGSGTLSGGNLQISDGSNVVLTIDIANLGSYFLPYPAIFTPGQALTITLADGGASVLGKVNIVGHVIVLRQRVLFGVDFSDSNQSNLMGAI